MRIACYNVMKGGFNNYEYDSPGPQRIDNLKLAVSELNADVIGLVDTFRWDDIYSLDELRVLFGYEYAVCINLNDQRLQAKGHNNGLTLLSKIKILDSGPLKISSRDALRATFEIDNQIVALYLLYLDDISEDVRLKQIKALLGHIDFSKRVMIMGDLNSFSSRDSKNLANDLPGLYAANPNFKQKLESILLDMQRSEVIDYLEYHGFQDADVKCLPTSPTHLSPFKFPKPIFRLDYCLYNAGVKINHFAVPKDDIYQRSSDHFPIVFEAGIVHKL